MSSRRKPKLGQNFLIDDAACHRIADALGNVAQSTVVEIGPGHGAITSILANRAKRLLCIELDPHLVTELKVRFTSHPNVEIVHADILATDLKALLGEDRAVVVGNLPYYITSDILLHLFAASSQLDTAVVMMQREVAERVSANPGVRDYGLLSVTTQIYADAEQLFTLPPEAFKPPPDVFSTVLRLHFASRFAEYGITNPQTFIQFLRQCFQQKRKTLANNLRSAGYTSEQIQAACNATQIASTTRAEALSPKQLAALHNALTT